MYRAWDLRSLDKKGKEPVIVYVNPDIDTIKYRMDKRSMKAYSYRGGAGIIPGEDVESIMVNAEGFDTINATDFDLISSKTFPWKNDGAMFVECLDADGQGYWTFWRSTNILEIRKKVKPGKRGIHLSDATSWEECMKRCCRLRKNKGAYRPPRKGEVVYVLGLSGTAM